MRHLAHRLRTPAVHTNSVTLGATISGGNPFPLPSPPPKDVAFPLAAVGYIFADEYPCRRPYSPGMSVCSTGSARTGFFRISYLGNKTSHLWLGNEINPAVYIPGTCGSAACSTTGNTQARRVLSLANPTAGQYYSQMAIGDDGMSANYNGMLTSIEHRFANNYTVLSNYTWSKCMGIIPSVPLAPASSKIPPIVRW